ncbi:MAG: VgrG-related protein [Streptosporangiales bacterium]|nr:VgrG-related protein [Streptosporangiales bacterium]
MRRCGGRSPGPTTSTTRCACDRAPGCSYRKRARPRRSAEEGGPAVAEQQQKQTATFLIKVDGKDLPAEVRERLMHGVVDDCLNLPDLFSLAFRDPDRNLITTTRVRIGSKVEISMSTDDPGGPEPLLNGEVTALEAEFDGTGTRTVIRGYDASHRLFRGRLTETWTNVTYADVARRVAQRAGLQPGTIDPSTPVHQHVSQGNTTDWQFLWRLANEVGYEVAVVDGRLDFRKPTESSGGPGEGTLASEDPLQLTYGSNLLSFQAMVTAAEQVGEVRVRGWDMKTKQPVIGSAPGVTRHAEIGVKPGDLAGGFNSPGYVGVEVPYGSQTEVDAAAKASAERIAGSFAELDGVARGNPKLRAGKAISLGRVGEPFDGKYTLTSTRHVWDPDRGYTTSFTVSGRQDRTLLSLTSVSGGNGANGGGGGAGRVRGIPGVASALVNDVNDPEKLGRVKVRFPWLSDSFVSDWVRVVQFGAGKERGAVVLPEVGDEVLVAFEQGDLRRPYVLGGLYNGVDVPKLGDGLIDASTGAVKRRGFVSKKGGALIFFDDDADEGVALLTGGKGMRVSLNKTKTTIRITSSGKIEISGQADVSVKANANLTLEATGKVAIKGAQVSIEAGGPVQVKGQPIQLN